MASLDLPPALVQAIRDQRAVLFLGAGASNGAVHPHRESVPTTGELIESICDKFLGGALKTRTLQQVSSYAINEVGPLEFQLFIRELFYDFEPADFHKLIPEFNWHCIATTNVDLLVDRAYEQSKLPGNLVEFYKDGQQFETEMKRTIDGIPFIRLHGSIRYHMETDIPLILSSEQYAKFGQNRQRLFARLRDMAYEFPLIFCDYSIADPHIQTILFDIFDLSIARPNYYVVLPNISGIESRY